MQAGVFKTVNLYLLTFSAAAMPVLQAQTLPVRSTCYEHLTHPFQDASAMTISFATYADYLHEAFHLIAEGESIENAEILAINNRLKADSLGIGQFIREFHGPEVACDCVLAFALFALIGEEYAIELKAGNEVAADALLVKWRDLGRAIAHYFAALDPTNISGVELNHRFQDLITTETQQILFYIKGDFPAAIQAYEQSRVQSVAIGVMIATALIDQIL